MRGMAYDSRPESLYSIELGNVRSRSDSQWIMNLLTVGSKSTNQEIILTYLQKNK